MFSTKNPNSPRVRLLDELKVVISLAKSAWRLVPLRHRILLTVASVMMAVISTGYVGIAILLGRLVDVVGKSISQPNPGEVLNQAVMLLSIMAAIYVLREFLNVLRRILVESSCTRLNCDIQRRVIEHVMMFDMEALSDQKLGSLHGKIFRSVDGLIHFVRLIFLDCLPAIFIGIFSMTTSIFKEPTLGIIMLGVVPISLILTLKQLNSQKGIRLQLMRDCENVDGIVVEQLSGIEYIRVADTLKEESNRLGIALEKRRKFELGHHVSMSIYGCGKALNESIFHIILLAIATKMAIEQRISVGDVMTFSVLFYNVMSPLNEVHRILDQGHESSLKVADLLQLLDTPVDCSFDARDSTKIAKEDGATSRPGIEMCNVHASYRQANRLRPSALKGISLAINRGETIGIAGHSGAGKSTWVKLILRLLHPVQGDVLFNGESLANLSRRDLANQIGYVGQHPFVFSGTISQNIAYGCGNVTNQQIVQAAKISHLHDDIIELLGGYDALVSERGHNLSGGQRQRIAITRAILKQPSILVLDEATSALDNIAERRIQVALGVGQGLRTTILIAHRLSTLRNCDRIFLFDHGQIVEVGSYHELVRQGGSFASLVSSEDTRTMAATL